MGLLGKKSLLLFLAYKYLNFWGGVFFTYTPYAVLLVCLCSSLVLDGWCKLVVERFRQSNTTNEVQSLNTIHQVLLCVLRVCGLC